MALHLYFYINIYPIQSNIASVACGFLIFAGLTHQYANANDQTKTNFFVDFSYATNHFRIECNIKRQAIECECEEGRNCNEKQENLGQKYQKINRAKQNVLCTTTPPIHYAFFKKKISWLLCIQYTINEIAVYLFVAHRCYFTGWNFFLVLFLLLTT